MRRSPSRGPLHSPFPLLFALLSSCGESPTQPDGASDGPISLAVVSGSGQSGVIGRELAQPVVVKVTDSRGLPLGGRVVSFVVTAGGGRVFTEAVTTQMNTGIARNYWTLGRELGVGVHTLEVRAIDPQTQEKRVYGTFFANGRPVPVAGVTPALPGPVHPHWTVTLAATLTDEEGTDVTGQRAVTWESLDPTIATVGDDGVVTGHAVGTARLVATSEGVRSEIQVPVTPAPVASVEVVPQGPLHADHDIDFDAVLRDARGHVVDGRVVSWGARLLPSNASVPISAAGVFHPPLNTEYAVDATSEGVTGTITFRTTAAPPAEIVLTVDPGAFVYPAVVRATFRDEHGHGTAGPSIDFSTSDPATATLSRQLLIGNQAGIVHHAPGTVTITAAAGSLVASLEYTVPDFAPDTTEPNDTREGAHTLPEVALGTILTVPGLTFHGVADVIDWYRVRVVEPKAACADGVPQPYRVRVELTNVPHERDYDLRVLDAGGVVGASKNPGMADEAVAHEIVGACGVDDTRDLWIEVRRAGGRPSNLGYRLNVLFEHR